MAGKRKGSRKGSKKKFKRSKPSVDVLTTVERSIPLIGVGSGGVGRGLVQVDRELSQMNERLYRQCRSYRVRFTEWPTVTGGQELTYRFFTLPNNWYTIAAIRYAYQNWLESLEDPLESGGQFSKWYDWRIEPMLKDGNSQLAAMLASMEDIDTAGSDFQLTYSVLSPDEYAYSKTYDSGGAVHGFAVGDGNSAAEYNIIAEYQAKLTSTQPDSMVVTHEGSYEDLHGASDKEIKTLLAQSGDSAPYDYDRETFRDGIRNWVLKETLVVDADSIGTSPSRTRFFDAPLGIVVVVKDYNQDESDFSTNQPELVMHVAKGKYKGVFAAPIVDFNPRKIEKMHSKPSRKMR